MLDLEHVRDLREFVYIHVDIGNRVGVITADFLQHGLQELARTAPVSARLQHDRLVTLQVLVPVRRILHLRDATRLRGKIPDSLHSLNNIRILLLCKSCGGE